MTGKVSVTIGNRAYITDERKEWGVLLAVTSYPRQTNRVLVFRDQVSGPAGIIYVFGGKLEGDHIIEDQRIANGSYAISGDRRVVDVVHFEVLENFKLLKIGSLLRELIIEMATAALVPHGKVVFPLHKEKGFYLQRGFHEDVGPMGQSGFVATVSELKAKPQRLEFQIFWKRENS